MIHLLILWAFLSLAASAAGVDDVFQAIRNNHLDHLRSLIRDKGALNASDSRGTTPLMYAASFGSLEAVRLLLEAGADVNVRNSQDATALLYAAWDPARAKLLVARGADVSVRSKMGRTPLLIAAGVDGNTETVELLLSKGAGIEDRDGFGITPLAAAASAGDTRVIRLLMDAGADVNAANLGGFTPLMSAVAMGNLDAVRLMLAKGAGVNAANTFGGKVRHGEIALKNLTPLMLAAPFGSPELVKTLLDAGAEIDARDSRGMTPLMFAVASETQDLRVVRLLLAKGADVHAKSELGESVLYWARKFSDSQVLRALETAGAKTSSPPAPPSRKEPPLDSHTAVQKSVTLLQRSTSEFFKQSGCIACHHQTAAAPAIAAARSAGIPVDDAAARDLVKSMIALTSVSQPGFLQTVPPPGTIDSMLLTAFALSENEVPADLNTDSILFFLAAGQQSSGAWSPGFGISRAPMEERDIMRTAFAVKALQAYGWPARKSEFAGRIARARAWLLQAHPKTSYECAELLLGLQWSGAGRDSIQRAAKALLAGQHADGGWPQNDRLASDAYATGFALFALRESGSAAKPDAAYRRGVAFLLKTQLEDGSWYVRSRAVKFQPYFQSGFPHDHDQWISAAATAYAVIALSR
ncbi:MAG: ankyrin repeat domain-containing protein [Acidobacteria bacterium]|nr:ankyrin repeat domain-containing protein [Acidobacteriota bacterium]